MPGYWIETEYFATFIGIFTPEQHTLFCQLCQSETEESNELFAGEERPALIFCDYTPIWAKHKSDAYPVDGFWKEVKQVKPHSNAHTFIKLIPDDAINIPEKRPPNDFTKKWHRYIAVCAYKNRYQRNPVFQKDTVAKDWDLMNDLIELTTAARGNYYREQKAEGEPATVKIENINELRIAVYEGFLMANNTEVIEKWHILSKTKYGGTGWADIAKTVLESEQAKTGRVKEISGDDIDKKATEVRRAVNKLRKRLQGFDVEEDQGDWDF